MSDRTIMIKSIQILAMLMALSTTIFGQQTFTLSSNDLGGEATINEDGRIDMGSFSGNLVSSDNQNEFPRC